MFFPLNDSHCFTLFELWFYCITVVINWYFIYVFYETADANSKCLMSVYFLSCDLSSVQNFGYASSFFFWKTIENKIMIAPVLIEFDTRLQENFTCLVAGLMVYGKTQLVFKIIGEGKDCALLWTMAR